MLDVTTALFVLVVGVSGTVASFHLGIANIRTVQERHIAMRAIENEVETLRALPFDELVVGEAMEFRSTTPECDRLVNAERLVRIAPSASIGETLKEISVSIRWTGENGRTIAQSVTTLAARLAQ